MSFRELAAEMDAEIFDALADDASIDGRPVRGMFSAPWLAPQIGRLKTGIVEPHIVVRNADAAGVENDAVVTVDGEACSFEVVSIEPDGTGITVLVLRPSPP